MPERTHYQVLGVDPSATAEQIRRAYRAKARAHHPDVSQDADAQSAFARVAAAYEVLSDRRKRSEYDLKLHAAQPSRRGSQGPHEPHFPWTNIATESSDQARDRRAAEFDEMYETFFKRHKPAE